MAPTAHRKLLLEVAFKLHSWDVEELRFFVKDAIPEKAATDALTVLGLLECLERRKLLGPGEYSCLQKYLKQMGREDLALLLAPLEDLAGPSLSRITDRLGLNYLVWPVNTFRCCTLRVLRELGKREVEQIRWLSQDFIDPKLLPCWSKELSGVELLDAMAKSDLIGPGNYSFLIDCLEEIGRLDLVELIMPPSIPYLPDSHNIPRLLNHKRNELIQLKTTQYRFGMQSLVRAVKMASLITAEHAGGWYSLTLAALSPKSLEKHTSYILENLPTTLASMSFYQNALLDAILEFKCNGDTVEFAEHVSECEKNLDILQGLMEKIDWDWDSRQTENLSTSRQYHPVRQVSYGAFSGVTELLLEFSGSRERLQEESRHLNRVLNRVESLLRLAGYLVSVTSWLVALLQVAVRSPVNLIQYDSLFEKLIHRSRHVISSNCGMFQSILGRTEVGRELLTVLRKKKLIRDELATEEPSQAAPLRTPFHVSVVPLPLLVFVMLLLSVHASLSPTDLEEILAALREYISEKEQIFCQVYSDVTLIVLQGLLRNIEEFRCLRLQEFHSENKHGIDEFLSF